MKNSVVVKSFPNGIALYLDKEADFELLAEETARRFRENGHFFRDAAVAVSFEGRELSFEEEVRLAGAITDNSGLQIACIAGRDEEGELYVRALREYRRRMEMAQTDGQFYRGSLKRGQILETESGIIVLGDVEPGACVIAAGSIIVLGKLGGRACAGGCGSPGHYIVSLEMTPQKLKIGDFKYSAKEENRETEGTKSALRRGRMKMAAAFAGRSPSVFHSPGRAEAETQPQMAYVENGRIVLRTLTKESLNSLA